MTGWVMGSLLGCIVNLEPPDLSKAKADVERGEYLANHVAVCISCHSDRDWRYVNAPNTDGRLGAGSGSTQLVEKFPEGTILWTRNITPEHLGSWSDGEVARAITKGLSRDGTPLFLNMPYDQFGKLSDDDVASIVAYLRTLPSQPDEVPARVLPYPLSLVVRFMPLDPELPDEAPEPGTLAYGEYLANVASCVWCHSPVDSRSVVVEGKVVAGGHDFPVVAPGAGVVYSANLTSDPSGITGQWPKEAFIARFKATDTSARTEVSPGGFNSPMPWIAFQGMTEEDLGAIYDYLKSLPPQPNPVTKYVPPAK